jgi:hypothetical protein
VSRQVTVNIGGEAMVGDSACEHCGSVTAAMTVTRDEHLSDCPCVCHMAWRYTMRIVTKSAKKRKKGPIGY